MRTLKLAAIIPSLAFVIMGLGMAPASAHSSNHNIGVSGSMYLLDYEDTSANESAWHSFTGGVVVNATLSQNQYSTSACVGGEVRGELRVTVNDSTQYPGWVYATINAKLYEGTSCGTGDLDGQRTFGAWIARGEIRNFTFQVNNTAEGEGDFIKFNFNVRNSTS